MLNISSSYMYSFSGTYYKGTEKLDKKYIESNFDYASLALSYGLSRALRITADIGYYFDKSQTFVNSDYTRLAQGISDATVGFNFKAYDSDDGMFDIAQSAKVTIPVGQFNQEYDGVILPIDLQPSSGNYRYNLGVIFSKRFSESPFSLMSFDSFEMSQAIETKNTYHKYGNLYNLSLMGICNISPFFTGFLQVRYEIRDRALSGTTSSAAGAYQYSYINSSGGVIAYVSPQISVNVLNGWMFSLQYNYPFYKNVYGLEQLTNRNSISLSLSRSINFSGEEHDTKPDATHSHVELTVQGKCDMCKTRIEEVANASKSVTAANWNVDTKILTVYYKETKPDIDELQRSLAGAGHDNDAYKAKDDVYAKLPKCCLYRSK